MINNNQNNKKTQFSKKSQINQKANSVVNKNVTVDKKDLIIQKLKDQNNQFKNQLNSIQKNKYQLEQNLKMEYNQKLKLLYRENNNLENLIYKKTKKSFEKWKDEMNDIWRIEKQNYLVKIYSQDLEIKSLKNLFLNHDKSLGEKNFDLQNTQKLIRKEIEKSFKFFTVWLIR